MPKEIKTVKVSTATEAQTIRAYQSFGWELLNNQEIYSKDSHLQRGLLDNKIYSVTETTHYVKLTFERDPTKVQNYQKLCELERAYYAVPYPPKKPRLLNKMQWGFLIGYAVFVAWAFWLAKFTLGSVIVGGIVALVYYGQENKRKKIAEWEVLNREFWAKREAIISKTDHL